MELTLDNSTAQGRISKYENHTLWVKETAYSTSLILSATNLIHPWPVSHFTDLTEQTLAPIAEMQPEVIIIGSNEPRFPGPEQLTPLMALKVGFEIMNIQAACRTYNVLLAEDRKVVAGILFSHT